MRSAKKGVGLGSGVWEVGSKAQALQNPTISPRDNKWDLRTKRSSYRINKRQSILLS
jgi:hypothetical protein